MVGSVFRRLGGLGGALVEVEEEEEEGEKKKKKKIARTSG